MVVVLGMQWDGENVNFDFIECNIWWIIWWILYFFEQNLSFIFGWLSVMLILDVSVSLLDEVVKDGVDLLLGYLEQVVKLGDILIKIKCFMVVIFFDFDKFNWLIVIIDIVNQLDELLF